MDNNQNNNKKKPNQPMKNPVVMVIIVSIIATFGLNFLLSSMSAKKTEEISYDKFIAMVNEDKVDEVVFQGDKITVFEKQAEIQTDANTCGDE